MFLLYYANSVSAVEKKLCLVALLEVARQPYLDERLVLAHTLLLGIVVEIVGAEVLYRPTLHHNTITIIVRQIHTLKPGVAGARLLDKVNDFLLHIYRGRWR